MIISPDDICSNCGHNRRRHMTESGSCEKDSCRTFTVTEEGKTKVRVILFKPSGKYCCEEEWRIPEGEVIPIPDSSRKRGVIGPYDMEFSPDFRRISGGSVLIETQEPWGYPHLFPGGNSFAPVVKAEEAKDHKCKDCPECGVPLCDHTNDGTTTAGQSPSYLKSVQSEQQPQYEERQASFRYQCIAQHVRTVVDRLAHMENTLELNHLAELVRATKQLSQLWPVLLTCEATECQDARKLVERALSNLRLELESSLRTHKEPLNSDVQQQ